MVAGLYICIVCLTGAALVFRIGMQRALHPDLFTPKASGPPAHPADIMDSVKRAFPDDRVSGVVSPPTCRPSYLAYSGQGSRSVRSCSDLSLEGCSANCKSRRSFGPCRVCTSACLPAAMAA